jgi:hypothetical protein
VLNHCSILFTWQESIITREEMVTKMIIIIVGGKVLLEALKKLHYCVRSLLHAFSCFMSNLRNLSRLVFVLFLASSVLYRNDFVTHFTFQFHRNNLLKLFLLNTDCMQKIKSIIS